MTSVSKLKDKARDFERKEDWNKAVDAYLQVIHATEKGDGDAELSLYNRVGDLYLRLGRPTDAVEYYAKAADHYGEAGLYNNAIALCNKALRYQPERVDLYRKLGKLSAAQGFITDARRWYLEYAERLAKQGQKDDAFEALKEFAGLSEDPEIREMLAAQLEQQGERAEAVTQLRLAYSQYVQQGDQARIEDLRGRILQLAPELDPSDLALSPGGSAGAAGEDLPGIYIDKGASKPEAPAATAPSAEPEADAIGVDEGFGFVAGAEPEAAPLPGLDEGPGVDETIEAEELPGLLSTDMGVAPDEEVLAADLPTLDIEKGASLVDEEEATDETPGDFALPTFEDALDFGSDVQAEPLPGLEGFEDADLETEQADEESGAALPMLEGDLPPLEQEEVEAGGDDDWAAEPLPDFDEETDETAVEPLPGLDADLREETGPGDVDAPAHYDEWEDFAPTPAAETQEPERLPEFSPTAEAPEEEALEEMPPEELPPEEQPPEEQPIELPSFEAAEEELDVDHLIRSAQERLEQGERSEALASLDAQHANLADANRLGDAYRVAEALTRMDPDAVAAHQARVEYAFRLDDRDTLVSAYLDFAACLKRTGAAHKAESVYRRVLEIDPQNGPARAELDRLAPPEPVTAPDSGFIDLGGLLMEEDENEEMTRFVVAETVESGDEERDFADMLSQFRAKIAQHVPQEDTDSHYDLGIAFKEMGLIDEAISEFQIALRGGNERLKVYEELGACFMKKEQYNIAAKLLARGAQLPAADDSELLGVYYQLGRCYEELGQNAEAREAYERVLGLDVNFQDVNARLGNL